MREEPSSVELQDPTIKQLGKKGSCLRRSCASGLGCAVFFIIAVIMLIRVAIGGGTQEIKGLPSHFPRIVPLYNEDHIQKIQFVGTNAKRRGYEIAALVPKLILAPIFLSFNPERPLKKSVESGQVIYKKDVTWTDVITLFKTPITKEADTVAIEWSNLGADMKFIADYYRNEFEKAGFTTETLQTKPQTSKLRFTKDQIVGTVYIEDYDSETRGTDYVTLTVDIPPK